MGKGSVRRPTDEKAYRDNYDAIFNKRKSISEPNFKIEITDNSVFQISNRFDIFDKAIQRIKQKEYEKGCELKVEIVCDKQSTSDNTESLFDKLSRESKIWGTDIGYNTIYFNSIVLQENEQNPNVLHISFIGRSKKTFDFQTARYFMNYITAKTAIHSVIIRYSNTKAKLYGFYKIDEFEGDVIYQYFIDPSHFDKAEKEGVLLSYEKLEEILKTNRMQNQYFWQPSN